MAETVTEYVHLAAKKRECRGNTEPATVTDVAIGRERVVLTAAFEWSPDPERLSSDPDDDRDVLKFGRLTETAGFEFEQVTFLEGESIELTYTGEE